jgi:metallophosphoesterase superfamily enzyme
VRKSRVLVIGDLHAPFIKKGYLEHCKKIYKKYKCNKVVLIGDIIDNHYSSFHDPDPDGFSAGQELDRAIAIVQDWYKAFPKAFVCIGNHDAIICRKAYASGVSNRWIRDYDEVLGTPGWVFDEHFVIDGVYYVHGTGSSGQKAAYNRMVNWGYSVVQGHLHTECSIMWKVDIDKRLFSMQVGCGVDDKSYAMAYAKNFTKKYIISCGVVLENGTLPILEPQPLV